MKKQRGFTLIELLVVIAIIGILSTIVMVSLNTARSKARDSRRFSDIRQIQLALQLYFDKNAAYPATLATLATAGFLNTEPKDPGAGNPVYLYCVSTTKGYHLGANQVENSGGPLTSDADEATDGCGSGTFDGADGTGPYIYDVIP